MSNTLHPPVSVVCALIWQANEVLLARRSPERRLGGLWEFPGGKVEPQEDPQQALHRELVEELGCRVRITGTLPPVHHTYPWCQIVMHPFLCNLTPDSPPPLPLEHTELAWVAWRDIDRFELAPADLPILTSFHPGDLSE